MGGESGLSKFTSQPDWGTFISPDESLHNQDNLHEKLNIKIFSGFNADYTPHKFKNILFDSVSARIQQQSQGMTFEDQCSPKYYFDIFSHLQAYLKNIRRIAEVGVYMGGSSCIMAGCIEDTDVELDLIDLNKRYLRFTYERIRRLFPKTAARTRLFFGSLPVYVKNVMLKEQTQPYMVHHDGAHEFNTVVKDLAALSFVREKVFALMIQDTHLRGGNIDSSLFVDAAIFAIFGDGLRYGELGAKHPKATEPAFEYSTHGTYFNANQPEGMFIPFANLAFRYPHPSLKFENLFP